MNNKKKHKIIFVKIFFFVLSFVFLFYIPKLSVSYGENFELIYKSFVGKKCEYQGFIEVWNIDTFEAGARSKTDILKECAKVYQKKNRGLFVMIRNLLPNECLNLLEKGESPDLFSCGVGFTNKIKDYVCAFGGINTDGIYNNYKQAGTFGESQFGVAWCSGSYFLISTADKLSNAKIETLDIKLADIVFDVGYEKKVGKNKKIVYSVGYGSGDYICPQNCFEAYNKKIPLSDYAFNENKNLSTYGAYAEFLAGKSTVLLGTQRDMIRIEGRIKNNKISSVIFEPVISYNDLVQFFLMSKLSSSLRAKYAQKFAEFVLSKKMQNLIISSGLISTVECENHEDEKGIMFDITPEIIKSYELKKIF